MSIGYASKTLAVPAARMVSVTQRLATPERLAEVIGHNLEALDATLDYNARQGIRLFRISSDVIPFGSSPVNTLDWTHDFADQLAALGAKARRYTMRLSMHPGQYTVLNSPNDDVVARAQDDLAYHATFLDALGLDATAKIVLHVGGVYGDKAAALTRFARAYDQLPDTVKRRLVVENDDRLFTACDVLQLSEITGAPVVFDTLHHELNHEPDAPPWLSLVDAAAATWDAKDGVQKIHYAQQAPGKRAGSHSDTIAIEPFLAFYRQLEAQRGATIPDIMLEVKDKNISAVKCILCTRDHASITALEQEWARYKYAVLEHSQAIYQEIRRLLKDKDAYPVATFYDLVEQSLALPPNAGAFRNAAQHVWGYVSPHATERERTTFARMMDQFDQGATTSEAIKRKLATLAEKYHQTYLLDSYYFAL